MKLPKITFKAMSFEENMDMIAMFINQEAIIEKQPNTTFFKKHYSELAYIKFTKNMTEKQIGELLKSKLFDSWQKDMEDSEQKINALQNEWNLINDNVMLDLSKRLNIEWPEDIVDINARVGIMFSCPRYISHRTFDINININTNQMKSLVIHEITHFLYFEKWKELYNDNDESHYNLPHIIWYLSEAIIGPLLNNEVFTKYTNQEINSNDDMREIIVNGESIVEILQDIINDKPIEEAIKEGYNYFLDNEEVIKGE